MLQPFTLPEILEADLAPLVLDLAVAGAARILKREIDPKAHADLLAQIRQEL